MKKHIVYFLGVATTLVLSISNTFGQGGNQGGREVIVGETINVEGSIRGGREVRDLSRDGARDKPGKSSTSPKAKDDLKAALKGYLEGPQYVSDVFSPILGKQVSDMAVKAAIDKRNADAKFLRDIEKQLKAGKDPKDILNQIEQKKNKK